MSEDVSIEQEIGGRMAVGGAKGGGGPAVGVGVLRQGGRDSEVGGAGRYRARPHAGLADTGRGGDGGDALGADAGTTCRRGSDGGDGGAGAKEAPRHCGGRVKEAAQAAGSEDGGAAAKEAVESGKATGEDSEGERLMRELVRIRENRLMRERIGENRLKREWVRILTYVTH
jgi:hypothetical protein